VKSEVREEVTTLEGEVSYCFSLTKKGQEWKNETQHTQNEEREKMQMHFWRCASCASCGLAVVSVGESRIYADRS
jgi:hypothetical protein